MLRTALGQLWGKPHTKRKTLGLSLRILTPEKAVVVMTQVRVIVLARARVLTTPKEERAKEKARARAGTARARAGTTPHTHHSTTAANMAPVTGS